MQRARDAGYSALILTIDTPVAGLRERDLRNGAKELLTRNPGPMLPLRHPVPRAPRWLARFFRDGGLMKFPNVMLSDGPMLYADVGVALEQSDVTWADLQWIREIWQGPIVVKGVHTGDDARRAIDAGADAIVVLESRRPAARRACRDHPRLPEVIAAAGGQIEVLLDSGIRRGAMS